MAIQIEINDAHIDALIDFYIQRLRVLRDEISEREKESKEINAQILTLKKGKGLLSLNDKEVHLTPAVEYSEKWPWVKKIRFAINQQGRALTTKEIIETLTEYEIGLMFNRKKAVASVSSMLSTKSGEGKDFLRIESESGDFAYDLNKKDKTDEEKDNDDDVSPFE